VPTQSIESTELAIQEIADLSGNPDLTEGTEGKLSLVHVEKCGKVSESCGPIVIIAVKGGLVEFV
jgi:hypothetical protein